MQDDLTSFLSSSRSLGCSRGRGNLSDFILVLLTTCKDLRQEPERQGKGLVQVKAAL